MTRKLHLSEPYDSRSTPHTAMRQKVWLPGEKWLACFVRKAGEWLEELLFRMNLSEREKVLFCAAGGKVVNTFCEQSRRVSRPTYFYYTRGNVRCGKYIGRISAALFDFLLEAFSILTRVWPTFLQAGIKVLLYSTVERISEATDIILV